MSTIATIEDKLIETLEGLALFRKVSSLGRKAAPVAMAYPSAYAYFVSDRDTGTRPRPVMDLTYEILVVSKNLSGEAQAAADVYSLLDAARDAINGKFLDFTDIEPFTCVSREIAGYEDGVISYILRFQTRQFLPVPAT